MLGKSGECPVENGTPLNHTLLDNSFHGYSGFQDSMFLFKSRYSFANATVLSP